MNKLEKLAVSSLEHAIKEFDNKKNLIKIIKILEKLAICVPSGMAPHKAQYKIAEGAGIKPATQTLYSAGFGLTIGLSRYLIGDNLEHFNTLNLPKMIVEQIGINNAGTLLKYWGVYSFTDASVRFLYSSVYGKPLGTFLWEAGYFLKEKFSYLNNLLEDVDGEF